MRCEFIANPRGGIRVIPEFEVDRLCLLEGSNGIGKTLAVHLLELATGKQPYVAAPAAWKSLKEGLGNLRIRISQLRNGDIFEIELTPSTWPDNPAKGEIELGHAWYNGQPVDTQRISSILHVTRIAGDEDIINQFQRVITVDAAVVGQQLKYLETFTNRVIDKCNELLQDIRSQSRSDLEKLITRQRLAEERLAADAQAHEQRNDIIQALDQLSRKQDALQKLQQRGPDIESQLADIEAELDMLQPKIDQLKAQYAQHLPDAQREETLLAEIERLRSRQTRQTEQLQETATKLNNTLAELRLSDVDSIGEVIQQTTAQIDELAQNRELLVATPSLITLIRELRMKLETVRGSNLDMKVVATIGKKAVQTRELRDGLAQREQELTKTEQQTFLENIDSNIQSLQAHLRSLINAAGLQKDLQQKRRKLDEIENSLRMKMAELDTNRDARYQRIAEELGRLGKNQLELSERRGTLRSLRSILMEQGSINELMDEIASIRNNLPETTGTFEEEQMKLATCRNRLQEARVELEQANEALAVFERRLQDTLTLLNQSPDYAWLRATVADQLPTMNDDHNVVLERLERLEQAIWKFEKLPTTLSNRTGRLKSALELLAQNNTNEGLNNYLPALIDYYQHQFGALLADTNIRHVLFDNGTFERLDLRQQVVVWKDANGESCRRPLEAFSSGERAFAHVLGSILQQRQITAKNHLLVLDEFGAFIEADRIERLERFLHDEVLQTNPESSVIIILPLRAHVPLVDDGLDKNLQMLAERGYQMKEEKLSR